MLDLAFLLLRPELPKARQELVPVDDVAVDLGAVDAGVFAHHLAVDVDRHHARAAHAGGVDHDRVQAGDGLDAVGLGQFAYRAHHQRRADGDDLGDLAAFAFLVGLEQFFQRAGDEAFDAETAVVAGVDDFKLVAEFGFELADAFFVLGPEEQVGVAEAGNQGDVVAHAQMFPHDRVDRRQADAARRKYHRLVSFVAMQVAGSAERPGNAGKGVANGHAVDFDTAGAHGLYDEADGAGFGVPVGQGQRDQFAVGPRQHAHELAGARGAGDQR